LDEAHLYAAKTTGKNMQQQALERWSSDTIGATLRQARLRQAQLDQMYQDQLRDLGRAVIEKIFKGQL
jgi:erythromycin esterase-like protein